MIVPGTFQVLREDSIIDRGGVGVYTPVKGALYCVNVGSRGLKTDKREICKGIAYFVECDWREFATGVQVTTLPDGLSKTEAIRERLHCQVKIFK